MIWPWFNEEERLEAMAYEEETRANAERKRLRKAHAATKDGGSQGERPLTMSIDPNYEELLAAGFKMHELLDYESARHDILESGTKERLISSLPALPAGRNSTNTNLVACTPAWLRYSTHSLPLPPLDLGRLVMRLIPHGHSYRPPPSYATTLALMRSMGT
jgi:hypothetical protein